MAEKEKKKRKRRIKGDAFWKLKSFAKKSKEAQKEVSEWEAGKAEELELYIDQINWITGAIFDPMLEIKEGKVVTGKVIGRLSYDVIKEHKERMVKVESIEKEIIEFRDQLSEKLNVWPDMINLRTGIISNDDYEGIDPDNIEKEIETEEEEEEK